MWPEGQVSAGGPRGLWIGSLMEAWGPARPWLWQVGAYAGALGAEAQEEYLRALGSMCQKLRSAQYNGSYFDRGAEAGSRLCTREGWFSCQVSSVLHPRSALVA